MYDIGIIGGGTAGLTAAIYARRAGKRVILIEAQNFGGQIVYAPEVENYPGIKKISGSEFADGLVDQALSLGMEAESDQVNAIEIEESLKVIHCEHSSYPCRNVIIATGVNRRKLGVAREEELVGKGVSYCAVCDGAFFKGQDVAVIGGGNTALEDAAYLAEYCSKVYLIHRRDEFRGEEKLVAALKEKANVTFVLNSVTESLKGESFVEGIEVRNKQTEEKTTIPVAGIFVAVGHVPSNDVFANVVDLNQAGYIIAGEDCLTKTPGVFAAGDCRTKKVRQLTTAAADGATAALAASQE